MFRYLFFAFIFANSFAFASSSDEICSAYNASFDSLNNTQNVTSVSYCTAAAVQSGDCDTANVDVHDVYPYDTDYDFQGDSPTPYNAVPHDQNDLRSYFYLNPVHFTGLNTGGNHDIDIRSEGDGVVACNCSDGQLYSVSLERCVSPTVAMCPPSGDKNGTHYTLDVSITDSDSCQALYPANLVIYYEHADNAGHTDTCCYVAPNSDDNDTSPTPDNNDTSPTPDNNDTSPTPDDNGAGTGNGDGAGTGNGDGNSTENGNGTGTGIGDGNGAGGGGEATLCPAFYHGTPLYADVTSPNATDIDACEKFVTIEFKIPKKEGGEDTISCCYGINNNIDTNSSSTMLDSINSAENHAYLKHKIEDFVSDLADKVIDLNSINIDVGSSSVCVNPEYSFTLLTELYEGDVDICTNLDSILPMLRTAFMLLAYLGALIYVVKGV